jgi:GH24 family phage-related lysozyme (muramidase)
VDYDARFYDPLLGRFVQADTVVPGIGQSQAFNRYAYVSNNPISFNDPSGHNVCDEDGSCYGVNGKYKNPLRYIYLQPLAYYTSRAKTFPDGLGAVMSEWGLAFLETEEGRDRKNEALYNDGMGNCTVGHGSKISSQTCETTISEGKRIIVDTANGIYYLLDVWENRQWDLNNISRDPVNNPILQLSDQDAVNLMLLELYHQNAMLKSQLDLTIDLNSYQWDAIQSFIYNTGKTKAVAGYLNNGDIIGLAGYIRNYSDASGLQGLINRRQEEADLLLFGNYDY